MATPPSYLSLAGVLAASAAGILAANPAVACVQPGSMVYAIGCASTGNNVDGQTVYIDGTGTVQVTTTDNNGSTTAPSGVQSPSGFQTPPSGATSEVRTSTNSTAAEEASGRAGDQRRADYSTIQFISGDTADIIRRINAETVVPSLHAYASGSATGPAGFNAAGGASFSDVISVNPAQLRVFTLQQGTTYTGIVVDFTYHLSGSVTGSGNLASGAFADGAVDFSFRLTPLDDPEGNARLKGVTVSRQTSYTSGEDYTVTALLVPGYHYNIQASLTTSVEGAGRDGQTVMASSDYRGTASYLGATFYSDDGLMTQLPNFDLNSQYGYTYETLSPPDTGTTPVPEPASLALLGVGVAGIAAARRRRGDNG